MRVSAEGLRRLIELANDRPMTRRERGVLAAFLLRSATEQGRVVTINMDIDIDGAKENRQDSVIDDPSNQPIRQLT